MNKTDKRALYVGGLDNQVTEQGLYTAFVPFGPIKSVQIPLDYHTQSELFGRTLRVTIAKPDRPKLGSDKPVWAEADESMDAEDPVEGGDSGKTQV
ncbi:ABC transporter A family member 1 [Phytophthora nicotianae]|uniref:ABC transporter A family member 1 n=1 Tax=Phytophthora nicotianae TaxID=4792 RepID=A0A0W8DM29_PHYNI|nr:ABC transporter A family member 1 [Phytophthora nicotianae]